MKLIAFIAHPDDEVFCGGLLAKNTKEKGKNLIICFTGNKKRQRELKESAKIIGAKVLFLGFEEFKINYSKIRYKLIEIVRKFKPDIAITQSFDYHLDHQKVNRIIKDILEFAAHNPQGWLTKKILEMETSTTHEYPDVIYDVSQEFKIKKEALKKHISQVKEKEFGSYYSKIIEAKAKLRGAQIGTEYGEGYKLHHLSIKGNFYPKSRGYKKVSDIFKK
jgi:LmbE family N-acetylglucosaminyl deacetylase